MEHELRGVKGSGRSWQNIYDTLWTIATVRYTTQEQLKAAFPDAFWREKCGTDKVLKALAAKGYLSITPVGVVMATAKAVDFLKTYSKYNTQIIKLPQGKGEKDALSKAQAFLELLKRPHFYALFYPEFYRDPRDIQPFLVPDAALVETKDNKARLTFIEVEQKKPDWRGHLEGKQRNYEAISTDHRTWAEWWAGWCRLLGLGHCPMEEFCFSIVCYGQFRAEWNGWDFRGSVEK